MEKLRKELNDKDILFNEYKKRLDILDIRHKQEIQELKKELEETNIKDKDKVLKKLNELIKEKEKYTEEKQIIEQELNKKEQELNKKEQELQNKTRKINDLENQNKLLKDGLEYQKKSNDLKTKENDDLRNEIEKLKKAKVQKSNIIDNLTKSDKLPEILQDVRKRDNKARTLALASSTLPKIFQDVRKRDDKGKTFTPPDNDDEIKQLAEITKIKLELGRLKTPDDLTEPNPYKKVFGKIKRPEDLESAKILENINKYEDINLNDVNNLIDEIKKISLWMIMF